MKEEDIESKTKYDNLKVILNFKKDLKLHIIPYKRPIAKVDLLLKKPCFKVI